ncbi:MAG TPA: pirin-like C-terminal cupin domain-containing protein [Iamia sp.]|nr:pirin-like C-terminal cupin domain-containing protein [Iamia sp.]HXH59366.1 pirin-like C-terminal cupin domain-containing protein [Iamia sp.]
MAIWHLRLEPGARWTLPRAAGTDTVRTLYIFDGTALRIEGHHEDLTVDTGAVVRSDGDIELSSPEGVEVLMLQGRPIGEPVARHGPFVMNTDDEIRQAFDDYQATQFGGWPWADEDPVHPPAQGRFARHADGRVEELEPQPVEH